MTEQDNSLAARILDAALALADQEGWERVRLRHVAATLNIPLRDIQHHYREKEDLVSAWFNRADRALLDAAAAPGFSALDTRARLRRLITAWLDALAPHRRATRQMVLGKFEPGHLHVLLPAVLHVSRMVQWLREAAGREAAHACRAMEETALTGMFLGVFAAWLVDDTVDATRTQALLDRLLGFAESMSRCWPGGAPRNGQAPSADTAPPVPAA